MSLFNQISPDEVRIEQLQELRRISSLLSELIQALDNKE